MDKNPYRLTARLLLGAFLVFSSLWVVALVYLIWRL